LQRVDARDHRVISMRVFAHPMILAEVAQRVVDATRVP
jgi:hypothetical protein